MTTPHSTPKRAAIVGTAPSWAKTPWNDPSLVICGLNDAYNLGIPRANAWYDLHPIDGMYFRPRAKGKFVDPSEVPADKPYIRPEGHLEWLQKQATQIPVFLQEVPEGWPLNAQRFPIEDAKKMLQARPDQESYVASSPALMLAHLLMQGYTEIHIYGIHLATEQEYREQRPQFEWLIGRAMERGVTFILPEECPLLKHTHIYGYEQRPEPIALEPRKKLAKLQKAHAKLVAELVQWPRWKSKDKPFAELRGLEAQMLDCQQQISRAHALAA